MTHQHNLGAVTTDYPEKLLEEQQGDSSAAVKKLLSEVSLEIELAKKQKNIVKAPENEVPTDIKKTCLTEIKEGESELGPDMKKALETELQDVMIKMWQELPDDFPSALDKHVIDQFRGELGDEFSNLLGLNVRKRILGLSNTLFVKVKFDSFISAACLAGFLKQYHVQKAKRVGGHKYMFVAKMKDYDDFDALCNTKDLIYDQVKFNVEPCYKFMTCPEILTTDKITADTQEEKKEDTTKSTKSDKPSSKESSRYERTKDTRSERYRNSARDREEERSRRIRIRIKDGVEVDNRKYREEKSDGKSKSSTNGENKSKSSKTSAEVKAHNSSSRNKPEVKSKASENIGDNKAKTENSDCVETKTRSPEIKTDSERNDNRIKRSQNTEKKDENLKSKDPKASEGSKDLEIGDDLDFEDMAMLLADSIVLDECSGSEDEEK